MEPCNLKPPDFALIDMNCKSTLLIAFSFILLGSSRPVTRATFTPLLSTDSLLAIVEDALGAATADDHAGTAVVVVQDDTVMLAKTYGLASIEHRLPVADSTVFHIASVSKQFTGFAIAKLIAEGAMSLTDPVSQHLTDFPDFAYEVTVEDLLYHRSGLREWSTSLFLAGRAADDAFSNQDVRRMVAQQQELSFRPGSRFVYVNTNYTLLAEIVAAVTGKSFKQYLESEVFEPVGMQHSRVRESTETIIPNRAGSYFYRDGRAYDAVDNLAVSGASGIYASISDLAKWGRYLLALPRTDPEIYRLLRRRAELSDGTEIPYAFGFWPARFYGVDWIDHTGSWAGARAYSTYFPEHGLAIFTLKNYDERNYLGQHLAAAILKDHLNLTAAEPEDEASRDTLVIDDDTQRGLVGVYKLDGKFLRLQRREGELYGAVFPAAHGDTAYSEPVRVRRFTDSTYSMPDLGISFRSATPNGGIQIGESTFLPEKDRDEKRLRAYTGHYYSEELNVGYEIRLDETGLRIGNLNNGYFPMRPIVGDEFDVPASFMDFVSIRRDSQGRITGLRVDTERSANQLFHRISTSPH